jgi:hypothetical protein
MRLLSALALGLALALTSAHAGAFCRSSACPPREDGSTDGHVCHPAQGDDCGVELQWRQPCVGFNIQRDASSQVDYATADATLNAAFAAWLAVDCGGGPPAIEVLDLGAVACAKIEYNQHAGNANTLIFRDDTWPHTSESGVGSADTLALTTVTYDVEKGDIYDADIEVNSVLPNTFSTTDAPGPTDIDLLSVLTHEVGHFLGLAHSADVSTMFPDYTKGTIDIRTLQPDDQGAICTAYPPGRHATGDCTGLPRHGYAPECVDQQTYVKCGVSAGQVGGPDGPGGGAALAAIAAALAARARGRRGSRRS